LKSGGIKKTGILISLLITNRSFCLNIIKESLKSLKNSLTAISSYVVASGTHYTLKLVHISQVTLSRSFLISVNMKCDHHHYGDTVGVIDYLENSNEKEAYKTLN
jgi:hypothetical protein